MSHVAACFVSANASSLVGSQLWRMGASGQLAMAQVVESICPNSVSSSLFPKYGFPLPLLTSSHLRAISPVQVTLSREDDGWYVLEADDGTVYGDGATIAEAIRDFRECFVEYLELVESSARSGNPFDAAELLRLGQYLVRTNPE